LQAFEAAAKALRTLTDVLPPDAAFVSATTPACSEASGTVTCDLGPLASGSTASVDITVRPQSAGSITNQPQVSGDVSDPDSTNNSAIVQTTVSSPPPPPPSGGGAAQQSGPLKVVLTNSYVLISGRSVKLVKGRFVPVKLTCAGQRKCEGTITVTTDKPIKTKKHRKGKGKRKRPRIAHLGSGRFSIEGNRQQNVLVPLRKSMIKLLRRLKRVKARATLREIDVHGNPRISMRSFTLRAR
jgi:hypothetical protein